MTSLQAVLLLGAGFLVVWGLMELFEGNKGTARANTALTLRGEFKRPAGGRDNGPRLLPSEPGLENEPAVEPRLQDEREESGDGTAALPPAQRGTWSLLWDLYAQNLDAEGRDELDRRLNSNLLTSMVSFLPTAEIEVQRIREIRDPGERYRATAFGALMFGLDLVPAKPKVPVSKVGSGAVRTGNALRRLKLPDELAKFLDEYKHLGGSYQDLVKKRNDLVEKFPELRGRLEVHHIPQHAATDLTRKDGPAFVMLSDHHQLLPSSRNDVKFREEMARMYKENPSQALTEATREVANLLRDMAEREGAAIKGPLYDAYDRGIREAMEHLVRGPTKR